MAIRSTAAKRDDAAKREDAMEQHAVKPKLKPEPVSRPHRTNEDGGLDRLIYERVRLGIMSALATIVPNLPPRGTYEQNKIRSTTLMDALHAQRGQLGA